MKLHELSPAEGSKKSVKRIGRGTASAVVVEYNRQHHGQLTKQKFPRKECQRPGQQLPPHPEQGVTLADGQAHQKHRRHKQSEQTGKSQAACIQRDAQCPGYLIAKEEKNYTQHNAMPELHPGPSLPLVIRYFYCTVPAAPRQHTKCTIPCKENCVPFRQS